MLERGSFLSQPTLICSGHRACIHTTTQGSAAARISIARNKFASSNVLKNCARMARATAKAESTNAIAETSPWLVVSGVSGGSNIGELPKRPPKQLVDGY